MVDIIWDEFYGETARPPFPGRHLQDMGPDNAGGIVEVWAPNADNDTQPVIEYHYLTWKGKIAVPFYFFILVLLLT